MNLGRLYLRSVFYLHSNTCKLNPLAKWYQSNHLSFWVCKALTRRWSTALLRCPLAYSRLDRTTADCSSPKSVDTFHSKTEVSYEVLRLKIA